MASHFRKNQFYDEEIHVELAWWLLHVEAWNGKAIFGALPDYILESDARQWAWDTSDVHRATGGHWTLQEQSLHINCLELIAGSFAVRSFSREMLNCCVFYAWTTS